MLPITLESVQNARKTISEHVHKTPVLTSTGLDRVVSESLGVDVQIAWKCESFQKTGSFKARGALNAVLSLSEEDASKGVICHSSGNHAQALAWAAKARKVPAVVVMPSNAPSVKRAAVEDYGAEIVTVESTSMAREEATDRLVAERGLTLIHPSNDPLVMAGQGTAGLEVLEQVAELRGLKGERPFDAIVVPVGGGGLMSGVATAVKGTWPEIRVFGAEPLEADDAYRSLESGTICGHDKPPTTVADGLRTTLGSNTYPVLKALVDRIIRVEEEAILQGMRLILQRLKVVVEPSAGTGVAALFSDELRSIIQDSQTTEHPIRNIAVILCGGNVELHPKI